MKTVRSSSPAALPPRTDIPVGSAPLPPPDAKVQTIVCEYCVVGNSGVGKTTFLEKLVRELKARGYRVAAIKHDAHDFQMDRPGKDTWRLAAAGSDIVLISAPHKLAMLEWLKEERTLDQLLAMVAGRVDIVLTEGYRGAGKPKIEVSRREVGSQLVSPPEELLAIASDQAFNLPVPQFGLDEASAVAEFLEGALQLRNARVVRSA